MTIEGLARVPAPEPAPTLKRSRLMVDITNSERIHDEMTAKGASATVSGKSDSKISVGPLAKRKRVEPELH
jgi:hypothetical protein